MRSKEKKSVFWKCYFIYIAVILIALVVLFFNVRNILIDYENNSPEKYIISSLKNASAKDGFAGEYLQTRAFKKSGLAGGSAREVYFYNTVKNAELSISQDNLAGDTNHLVYNVFADGKPFLKLSMSEAGSATKLGILNLSEWKLDYAFLRSENAEIASINTENGLLDISISAPSDFVLLMDGEPAGESFTEKAEQVLDEFIYIQEFADVPAGTRYSFEGLSFEPSFSAINDEGETIAAIRENDNSCRIPSDFASSNQAKQLSSKVDALAAGKLWSKFMTNDVGGNIHGFDTVVSGCNLLKGTNLYTLAYNWAHSVDITFVSHHVIDSWTNESVGNYVMYNDSLFSCDVYFEKNMTLTTRAKRTDVFSNRMYFVYLNDVNHAPGWYLAEMLSFDNSEE